MSLLLRTTLHSDSEHFILLFSIQYQFMLSLEVVDPVDSLSTSLICHAHLACCQLESVLAGRIATAAYSYNRTVASLVYRLGEGSWRPWLTALRFSSLMDSKLCDCIRLVIFNILFVVSYFSALCFCLIFCSLLKVFVVCFCLIFGSLIHIFAVLGQ
jgi:hypothetical protein